MSVWAALAIVLGVGVMTYVMRAVVIVAIADRPVPRMVERALRNVGPAVLAALAINLAAGGEGGPNLDLAEGLALVASGLVAWRTRNVLWTLAAGMAVLWIVGAFG